MLFVHGLQAQVEFKAVPSSPRIGINEKVAVSFVMNQDGDNFHPPAFTNFIAEDPQLSIQPGAGRKKPYSKKYTCWLTPKSKGTFTIGAATIEIDGKTYKTEPFKIVVGNPVQTGPVVVPITSGQGPDPLPNAGSGVHVVAEISNGNPYLNQAVTVTYKLYVGDDSDVKNFNVKGKPDYTNFWSQSETVTPENQKIEVGKYRGKNFRYVILQRTLLYPQKNGRLELDALNCDVEMEIANGRYGTRMFSAGKSYVNVKPLPEQGRPADFAGAVGSFVFKAKPSKTTLPKGESFTIDVIVSGKGNLKLFSLPKPEVSQGLEIYDPEHKENINLSFAGMEGSIADTYTVAPQAKGKFAIKPISFSWFDPATGKYHTETIKEIPIDVLKAPAADSGTKVKDGEEFRPVAESTTLLRMDREDFLGSGLFYILLLLPFALVPIVIVAKRKKEAFDSDVAGNRMRQTNKLAKTYLSEAQAQLGNKEPFYLALEKALHNFLKAKLDIETSDMSRDNIRQLLLSRKADPETVNNFGQIMDNCEFARYAPSSDSAMQQDFEAAVAVVNELEKQIRQ